MVHNIIYYYNFTSGTVFGSIVCKKIVANNIYKTTQVYVNDNDRPYWCRAYYVDCARRTRSYTSINTLHCRDIYIDKLNRSGRYRKTNDKMLRILNNMHLIAFQMTIFLIRILLWYYSFVSLTFLAKTNTLYSYKIILSVFSFIYYIKICFIINLIGKLVS